MIGFSVLSDLFSGYSRSIDISLPLFFSFGIIKHLLTGYSWNSKFIVPSDTTIAPRVPLGAIVVPRVQ